MRNLAKIILLCMLTLSLIGCGTVENKKINKEKELKSNSEFFDTDVEGKLQYKIIGTNVYHSLSEAGIDINDCTEPELDSFEKDKNHLKEGNCLLVLEVTAKNISAKNDFKNWDESIFRADSINLVTKDGSTVSPISNLCYFSLHDKCKEHPFAYKLPIGKSCTFKVGHVIGEDDLKITYVSDCSAYSKKAIYIPLDLGKVK